MRRQLRNAIMLVPVLAAAWLTFQVEPPTALPVDQVVAFEFTLPETVAQDGTSPDGDDGVQVVQGEPVSE